MLDAKSERMVTEEKRMIGYCMLFERSRSATSQGLLLTEDEKYLSKTKNKKQMLFEIADVLKLDTKIVRRTHSLAVHSCIQHPADNGLGSNCTVL